VGAVLDLAGHEWSAPEQAREQRQEPQQHPDDAAAAVAAGELAGPLLADLDRIERLLGAGIGRDELDPGRRGQAVGQARALELVVHLQPGRDQERGQHGQAHQREQSLLAVLAPDQPAHRRTS
jgi:hypothetical protein